MSVYYRPGLRSPRGLRGFGQDTAHRAPSWDLTLPAAPPPPLDAAPPPGRGFYPEPVDASPAPMLTQTPALMPAAAPSAPAAPSTPSQFQAECQGSGGYYDPSGPYCTLPDKSLWQLKAGQPVCVSGCVAAGPAPSPYEATGAAAPAGAVPMLAGAALLALLVLR